MELIDKADIISEIERRIKELEPFKTEDNLRAHGAIAGYYQILSFLRTLDVKDVDLEKEIGLFTTKQLLKKRNHSTGVFHLTQIDVNNIAKHFFELGLRAKDWREERMKECPYRQVGCTMYSGTILECRGACSWVVDYPKLFGWDFKPSTNVRDLVKAGALIAAAIDRLESTSI